MLGGARPRPRGGVTAGSILTFARFSPTATFGIGLVRAALLTYGLLVAFVAVDRYKNEIPDQGTLMSSRSGGVTASIRLLDSGGPPLAVAKCVAAYDYCELPGADDPGVYLYLPVLGHVLH